MKNRIYKALAATVSCVAFVGCASTLNTGDTSDFACDGNVNCPTPLEVYQDTHAAPSSVQQGRTPENWKVGKDADKGQKDGKRRAVDLRPDLLNLSSESHTFIPGEPGARPLREPSQVMRIWIAPWIDAQDSLNWSGYVFTEITPKRWRFGEQEVRHQGAAPAFIPQ